MTDQADKRWAKLVLLGCPNCGLQVLSVDVPITVVWCASCPSTPRLERTAT